MAKRPNILLILTDQHNPHIAGFAGDARARTGAMDTTAVGGTRFDTAYCQAPLCVPSRISLLTGRYVHGCGAFGNASALRDDQLTLPQHLSRAGYTTACIGKMHLRGPRWMGGFDHRPYGDLVIDRFCFHQPDPVETWDGRWSNHSVGRFPWAGITEIPESLLADSVVTRETISFLLEHQDAQPEKPWFVCAGYGRPHFPFTAPGRYFRRAMADPPPLPPRPGGYPDGLHPHDRFVVEDFHLTKFADDVQQRALAAYYACVDYVDDCIGELIESLRRAGLLENTYVICTSDHGEMAGEHGLWSKRSYYDASSRVPFLIAGPGIGTGQVVTAPIELLDLFPTVCDMAAVRIPEGLDGDSLMPILRGKASRRTKRFARSELYQENPRVNFRMARDQRWKYVEFIDAPPLLFDMVNDPGETTNLLSCEEAAGAPLDDLRRAASDGLSWDDVAVLRDEEKHTRPEPQPTALRGPVQYQLRDGRVVDADAFLYPGMDERV